MTRRGTVCVPVEVDGKRYIGVFRGPPDAATLDGFRELMRAASHLAETGANPSHSEDDRDAQGR